MAAGSKIKDTNQEYVYSFPFVTPSGHTFSFYDTPENERVVLRHTSGSCLEFKADGSVIMKAVKDFHVHNSAYSNQTTTNMGSDQCLARYDTDLNLVVGGKLNIKCAELNVEVGSAAKCVAGTDFVVSGNNVINKATESVSLEAAKSVYVDAKEYKERVHSHTVNMGSHEDTATGGGLGVMNVTGHFIIRNNDINGGITLASRGYMNLVSGQERCDVTGLYLSTPGSIQAQKRSTWTQKVFSPIPPGPLNVSPAPGGDYWFESQGSAQKTFATTVVSPQAAGAGLWERVVMGNHVHNVAVGARVRTVALNEHVIVAGIQTVRASKIFLN